MDCVMIQQVAQSRTSKHTCGTVICAEKVVEGRVTDLQAKREEVRKQQMQNGKLLATARSSWLAKGGTGVAGRRHQQCGRVQFQ